MNCHIPTAFARLTAVFEKPLVRGGILRGPGREGPDRVCAPRGGREGKRRRIGGGRGQRGRSGAAGTAARGAQRGAKRRARQGEQANLFCPGHRVAKKFPSMRFVAFSTASAAPRGGSASAR